MTSKENEEMWVQRVAAWKVSGVSMRAFALLHGWNTRQLGWWKKRLAPPSAPAPTAAMLPVTVARAPVSSAFRLAGANWSLDLPAATPASWLAELLRSL
ncbi:MAG TPA: hypothetical protein VFG03_20990 [Telluria sp.]|nr:hypothetical protein [Telluria sp.]